jgi:flagellin-like protein
MMLIKMNKKGISPLLATVFLIAFAVSLAVVVVNISAVEVKPVDTNNTEAISQKEACQGVSIDMEVIEIPYICYKNLSNNQGMLNYVLRNEGNRDIKGLRVSVLGEKSSFNRKFDLDAIWEPQGLLDKRNKGIEYDFSEYGKILKVTFVPIVSYKSQDFDCSSASLKLEEPLECP